MTDYKLVPVEPTAEMIEAIYLLWNDDTAFDDAEDFWRFLLSAAQQPAAQQPEPDVSALVEALEQCITSMLDSGYRANAVVIRAARTALAAHRKQQEQSND